MANLAGNKFQKKNLAGNTRKRGQLGVHAKQKIIRYLERNA